MTSFDGDSQKQPMTEPAELVEPISDLTEPQGSRLISRVLSPAARLWVRSQVEHVEDLHLQIEGSDRQLLSGSVRRVAVAAKKAIYQGIHLSQVAVVAESIRVNLGQVVRGKPLRLLQAFPIEGEITLQEADLNASLQAPLLANAVIEFLLTLLKLDQSAELTGVKPEQLNLQNPTVVISEGHATLSATLVSASGQQTAIVLRTGLHMQNDHTLKLNAPQWLPNPTAKRGLPLKELEDLRFDLGPDTSIRQLELRSGQLYCQGRLRVVPAE